MSSSYGALGVLTLMVGALGGLIWFAHRAGRNAAQVVADQNNQAQAQHLISTTQHMAQAQANKPATEAALLDRLDQGDA